MSPNRIEPARWGDLGAILALLSECSLPPDGVAEHAADFWVARDGEELVGTVGLEDYGGHGLLRSLAVRPARRGRGLGAELTRHALASARSRGMLSVFLLTDTAPDFFARLAFLHTPREAVPVGVRASAEFAGACPDTAACMRLDLDASSPQV